MTMIECLIECILKAQKLHCLPVSVPTTYLYSYGWLLHFDTSSHYHFIDETILAIIFA